MRFKILTILLALFTFGGLTASAQVFLSGSMGNHDVVTMQSGTVYYGRIVQHDLVNNKLFMATDYYVRSTERSSVRVVNARDVNYADLSPEFQAWYADNYDTKAKSVKTASLIDIADQSKSVEVILLTDKCTAELIWYVGKDEKRQQLGFEKVKHIRFTPVEGVIDVLQDTKFNEIRGCITSVRLNGGAVTEYNINVGGAVRHVNAMTISNCSCEVPNIDATSFPHTIITIKNEQYIGFLTINDNNTIAVQTNDGVKAFPPSDVASIYYTFHPLIREFKVNGVAFKMIQVNDGSFTFTMGATAEQENPNNDESPTHRVTLGSYMIGETEVSQALWKAVTGKSLMQIDKKSICVGDYYPMFNVSWDDCQEFLRKLNSMTGQNFRLPTEAEWEFAARGGNKSKGYQYSGSNNIGEVAWYYENSPWRIQRVATKVPNELGIYDMSGNVSEWCQDWYGSYSSSVQTGPQGPSSGTYRVVRGGASNYRARFCRSSSRNGSTPSYSDGYLGLRLAL